MAVCQYNVQRRAESLGFRDENWTACASTESEMHGGRTSAPSSHCGCFVSIVVEAHPRQAAASYCCYELECDDITEGRAGLAPQCLSGPCFGFQQPHRWSTAMYVALPLAECREGQHWQAWRLQGHRLVACRLFLRRAICIVTLAQMVPQHFHQRVYPRPGLDGLSWEI
jgi:hypothetical protein